MTLTDEQKASLAQWNAFGETITDAAMMHFMQSWYGNIRHLIDAHFPLHNVAEITKRLESHYDTFLVLGSGPSVEEVAKRLSFFHSAVLCGPTCVGALTRYAVRPALVVVADSASTQYHHILESKLERPDSLDVVLPVTCDPSWYGPESVLDRSRLYFYLPYLSFQGDTNIGYNVILKSLFPDVPWQITQAGSVANAALNIADWCCGESPSKRVHLAVDCSWIKGKPTRAPLRFEDLSKHSELLQAFWANAQASRDDVVEIPHGDETVVTDLVSLGYAINMLWMIHQWSTPGFAEYKPYRAERYALMGPASKLILATSPKVIKPVEVPEHIGRASFLGEEHWAYKALLALVEISNRLQDRLMKKNPAFVAPIGSHVPIGNIEGATK
jgi:hypothetical protein